MLDPAILSKGLAGYFGGVKRYQIINWLALFALGGAIALAFRRRQPLLPVSPAALNFAIGIGFFAFHSIVMSWYLMSHAVGALSGAATYMWLGAHAPAESGHKAFPKNAFSLAVVSLTLLLSAYFFASIKPSFDRSELSRKLRSTDIVYACETAGLFVQSGIYAACLFNGNLEFAQKVLQRVSGDGRRQFIAVEHPVAQAMLNLTCPGSGKREALTVAGFGLFMVPPNLSATNPDCR